MNPQKKKNIDINKLWLECSKRGIQSKPLIQTALDQLRINPFDQKCLNLILNRIEAYDVRELLYPEPFRNSNPKYSLPGFIRLGRIKHTNTSFNINSTDLTVHLVLAGRTGGGKSSVIKSIIKQLLEEKKR